MVQPIDEEKSGKFQFIYNEVRKVIPYLDHLMNTFAESVYSEQKLEMLCLDNTNVVSKKIDFNPAGSWKDMVQTAPPKSQVRIFEKTGVKYNYDFRRVLDEARGSFICNNMEEVNGVYYTFAKFLEARGCRILRVKNRFMQTCGKSDYADILLNAEIKNSRRVNKYDAVGLEIKVQLESQLLGVGFSSGSASMDCPVGRTFGEDKWVRATLLTPPSDADGTVTV